MLSLFLYSGNIHINLTCIKKGDFIFEIDLHKAVGGGERENVEAGDFIP